MTIPVLLLFADTGGGHRSAARAVADALEEEYPGIYRPLLFDPLRTRQSPRVVRSVIGLYGPIVRRAPWLWGAVYRCFDSWLAAELLRRTWLRLADAPVADLVETLRPSVVLSFHPLATAPAVRAVRRTPVSVPVVTVVTDLVATHATWRHPEVHTIVVPSKGVRQRCDGDGLTPPRCLELGLPVGEAFQAAPLSSTQRAVLRTQLGLDPRRFLAVLAGGAEGSGPIARNAVAITRTFGDVDVVAICGRNRRLENRLARLRSPHLTVKGFVDNMADWYRAADVVVTKAGPQSIIEAASCSAPLLITSHLPGQERGNTELVIDSGAGVHTPRAADVVRAIARLKSDPYAHQEMRRASLALASPEAARRVASLVARLTSPPHDGLEQHGAA